jgi:hypothetical protein
MDEAQHSFLDMASDSLQSAEHSLNGKNHSRDRPGLEIMSQVPTAPCKRDTRRGATVPVTAWDTR